MKKFISLFLVLFAIQFTQAQNASKSLQTVLSELAVYNDTPSAFDTLRMGKHPKGHFPVVSSKNYAIQGDSLEKFIDQIQKINDSDLTRDEFISKKLWLMDLNDQLANIAFEMYLIPFNAEGGFYNWMEFSLDRLPFNTVEDYELYLAWLPQYALYKKQYQLLMEEGISKGIVASQSIVNNAIKLLEPWRPEDITQSKFYKPFKNIPSTFTEKEKKRLLNEGKRVISATIGQFYTDFSKFLEGEYRKASPQIPGVSMLPNGKDYYKNRVHFYSTFDIEPEEVHAIGLEEVARIRSRMQEIIEEVEFDGNFEEFLEFLRNDSQFYAKTPQELLDRAAWFSKRAEAGLPKLFKKLYSLPFTVEPVPDDIAPTYTGGRYVPGSRMGNKAGIYWVNTFKLESRPLYVLPSLTLHEAVPGHHLQIAMVAENDSLPDFRKHYYISAFGEGWGLYSEFLGEEMGMYTTPYEWFGRYTYEMWRACRLVVDTGIHYMGWSRDEAIEYMKNNTALSLHEVTTEIDRYIGWPGQAISYKMGELKIKELREIAEMELGPLFNIQEFHDQVLKNGAVPLEILEEEIKNYISDIKISSKQ